MKPETILRKWLASNGLCMNIRHSEFGLELRISEADRKMSVYLRHDGRLYPCGMFASRGSKRVDIIRKFMKTYGRSIIWMNGTEIVLPGSLEEMELKLTVSII